MSENDDDDNHDPVPVRIPPKPEPVKDRPLPPASPDEAPLEGPEQPR